MVGDLPRAELHEGDIDPGVAEDLQPVVEPVVALLGYLDGAAFDPADPAGDQPAAELGVAPHDVELAGVVLGPPEDPEARHQCGGVAERREPYRRRHGRVAVLRRNRWVGRGRLGEFVEGRLRRR